MSRIIDGLNGRYWRLADGEVEQEEEPRVSSAPPNLSLDELIKFNREAEEILARAKLIPPVGPIYIGNGVWNIGFFYLK